MTSQSTPDSKTKRVYFAVPAFHGYGPEFDTYAEALAHCEEKFHSEFMRMFIDVRVVEQYTAPDGTSLGGSDHVVHRIEVPNRMLVQAKRRMEDAAAVV